MGTIIGGHISLESIMKSRSRKILHIYFDKLRLETVKRSDFHFPEKKQYERIESDNLLEIKISSPGKYVISNSKIYSENRNIIIFIIVGGVMLLVGVVSYIVLKKKYWFW